jgi:uncharacterized Tic20 family protein
MTDQTQPRSSEENLVAALSHLFGFLVALIVWATQKDKSHFVRFQAVQAMAFDLVISGIILLTVVSMVLLIFGFLAIGIGDLALFGSQNNPMAEPFRVMISLMTAIPFLIACSMIPLVSTITVARLIATIQTFQGKEFRYPWLGAFVERSMRY